MFKTLLFSCFPVYVYFRLKVNFSVVVENGLNPMTDEMLNRKWLLVVGCLAFERIDQKVVEIVMV